MSRIQLCKLTAIAIIEMTTISTAISGESMSSSSPAVLSFRDFVSSGRLNFSPDFSSLSIFTKKTTVNGLVPGISCTILKGESPETSIGVNAATTQYQGHYVWTTNRVVSGFGTYSAAGTSRSFGWILKNDTNSDFAMLALSVKYGQWGARNSLPDTLAFFWKVSDGDISLSDDSGWHTSPENNFISPFLSNAPNAVFPTFETKAIAMTNRMASGSTLAIKFVDTCPASGNNAHLGLASLTLSGCRSQPAGFSFTVK